MVEVVLQLPLVGEFCNTLWFLSRIININQSLDFMQLYALEEKGLAIFANAALRGQDYTCLECQGIVRVRGGLHRQNHFYHLQQERTCRQNAKGMEHIQLQSYLHRLLPGQCELEKRFPEIGRIADVVWESEKLIFEIQCSPISAEEVRLRIQDYESLGFRVVWILHDKQFNTRRISAAELYLTPRPHYYTNINKEGSGIIYDQFDVISKGLRLLKSPPFPVDLRYPVRELPLPPPDLPDRLKQRIEHAGLFFFGDLHQHLHSSELFAKALQYKPAKPSSWTTLLALLTKPYRILFRHLLEKASN